MHETELNLKIQDRLFGYTFVETQSGGAILALESFAYTL